MRRWLAIVVGTTLLLVSSACTTKSLDVETSSPSTEPRTARTEPADNTATTTPSVPSVPDTTVEAPTSTVADGTAIAGEPGSRAGQCPTDGMVEDLQRQFGDELDGAPPLEAMTAVLDLLALYVPPDLAADFQVFEDGLLAFAAALDAASNPSDMTMDELEAAFGAIDSPQMEAASQRVEDYFTAACPDIDWDGENFEPIGPTLD